MGDNAAREYFLGVNGEQSGPFTQDEIVGRIQSGSLPSDALIWYEGLSDWTPVESIPEFQNASANINIAAPPPSAPSPPPPAKETPTPAQVTEVAQNFSRPTPSVKPQPVATNGLPQSTFAERNSAPDTIFHGKESVFGKPRFLETRVGLMVLSLSVLSVVFVLLYFAFSAAPDAVSPRNTVRRKPPAPLSREQQVRRALSEITLKSNESLATLQKIIADNPNDKPAKDALEGAVDYYTRNRKPIEAGKIYSLAKLPDKAAAEFLKEPANFQLAEKALFEAYSQQEDIEKKHGYLVKNIELLLGPLRNQTLAIQRIHLLERDFAGRPHPFKYFSMPNGRKIFDIFARLKDHYTRTVLEQIDLEFPEITLPKAPRVELLKTGVNMYRLVAKYAGPLRLGRDDLPGITLKFWLAQGHWKLVDTNLTPERGQWARQTASKLTQSLVTEQQMLLNLEDTFRSVYPKTPLHELGTPPKK